MTDRVAGAAAAKKLLSEDAQLRTRIFAFAVSRTRDVAGAKDLAQLAIAKVIDPAGSPWDPDAQPNLFLHVGSVINTALANRRRAERRHPTAGYTVDDDARPDPEPTPEESAADAEDTARLARWMAQLVLRLAGDPIALGKLDLVRAGIDEAPEQAARLGCTVNEIYRANERIAYHVGIIKRTAGDGGLRRGADGDADARPIRKREIES